ncbi:MAG: hypothetical protein K2Q14_07520 [Gammaproteobacteria bacterium]|nr:hypothetical protein [Gammaproteobacteria bacterium]
MASLSVRKIDNTIYQELKNRAAQHGVSMEEEARQILYHSLTAPQKISAVFRKYFGPKNGVDLNLSHQRKPHDPMDFSE